MATSPWLLKGTPRLHKQIDIVRIHRSSMWFKLAAALTLGAITLPSNSIKMAAQETTQSPGTPVPTLVRFSGVLRDEGAKPLSGTVTVTFLLYKEQEGGDPLWLETQDVRLDTTGHYSVMLGSTSGNGLPTDIFVAGEARWLAVQAQGQPEQPRAVLLSVPYALKAADAETLGGLPVSAFARVSSNAGGETPGVTNGSVSSHSAAFAPLTSSSVTTTGGTVSAVPLWTTATNIQNSALTQTGAGSTAKIGINTNAPAATLDVNGSVNFKGVLELGGAPFAHSCCSVYNTSIGSYAGNLKTSGTDNTSVGYRSLGQDTTGSSNSALGLAALVNNTTGSFNTAAGTGSLGWNTSGRWNVAVGNQALYTNQIGSRNVGVGYLAGFSQSNQATTGSNNTFVGFDANPGTQTGLNNATAIGANAQVTADNSLVLGSIGGVNGAVANTNVGIGTTAPAATLDVHGTGNFTGPVSFNDNVAITGTNFLPLTMQSSSPFGTWLELTNTDAGGKTWAIYSTGGADGGGAGNLTITNFTDTSSIFLLGNVSANTLSIDHKVPYGGQDVAEITSGGSIDVASLLLKNTGSGGLQMRAGVGTGLGYLASSGPLAFITADTGRPSYPSPAAMTIDTSGNVNIKGDLSINGSISKNGGSFKIDHPLDPANKYLYHSFVESPDMMNIYNGVVTLDAHGSAWITMPDYFAALNRDFRYQLTSMGRPQPSLYVAEEMSGNRFRIAGGKSGGRVSWQVTGIRHDAYADAHRIPVEEDKPLQERGRYMHPELFGAPEHREQARNQR